MTRERATRVTSGRTRRCMASRAVGAGATVLGLLLTMPGTAWACPICFQFEESGVTDGVQAAVIVLVGVTIGVLSGFGLFIARFVRRSRSAS